MTTSKPKPCVKTSYTEAELEGQHRSYPQYLVVPYVCPFCSLYHLFFVNKHP